MKLTDQVCTPEQGKRLKELGIVQFVAICNYAVFCPDPLGENHFYQIGLREVETTIPGEHICDVFTVAELGVMLPETSPTNTNIRTAELVSRKDCGEWNIGYDVDFATEGGYGATVKEMYRQVEGSEFEAIARANLLIYLLENNYTTAEEVNTRLSS